MRFLALLLVLPLVAIANASELAKPETQPPGPPPVRKSPGPAMNPKYEKAPVMPVFRKALDKCAPGCEATGILTFIRTGNKRSCLTSGHSLNFSGLSCSIEGDSKRYDVTDVKFIETVKCLKQTENTKILFRTGKRPPHDFSKFVLFSIGCGDGPRRW